MSRLISVSTTLTWMLVAWMALALTGASCEPPEPEPIQPDPEHVVDPLASPCAQVCANMDRLKCLGWDGSPGPDGKMGTDDDMACTPACQEYIRQDPTADGYQGCQAAAATCDAMDACYDE